MPSSKAPRNIHVHGDITIDWNMARARPHLGSPTFYQYVWGSDIATRACSQPGGAALLKALLSALCEKMSGPEARPRVAGPSIAPEALNNPSNSRYARSYSVWSAHPQRTGDKKMVWRANEFWGSDHASPSETAEPFEGSEIIPWGIVLDDANLGFRERPSLWPKSITQPSPETEWVVVKMSHPVGKGPLWNHLMDNFADRTSLVVSVSDLRKGSLQIGYGLSWEQISGEIVEAVSADPQLSRPAAVVVPLGTTGSVLVSRLHDNFLIFDPSALEDDWMRDHPGMCVGYTSCLVAALACHFAKHGDAEALPEAIRRGNHAAQALHLAGYGGGDGKSVVDLQFPIQPVIEALGAEITSLSVLKLTDLTPGWTILKRRLPMDIHSMAARVVKYGPEVSLAEVPLERIGAWSSVDRTEIESIRSLRNIMSEYLAQARPPRPLSLAVFGPPGSGKSFAIKEVAKALMPGRLSSIEFNLSQFESHEELPAAFHRVRDAALRHELPLVFWDEFDTPLQGRELGWLRYFLAPMQDGEFREDAFGHPIGAAIFVFAGGVFSSLSGFRKSAEANPSAKGKDFLSRLRGFLNILGPNPQDVSDEAFPLRRALLLRSLFKRKAAQLFDSKGTLRIDEGVLCALLEIDQYLHGARSAECIMDMSALSGKLMFERSCLPAPHQLALHVDAEKFLDLVEITIKAQ
jgi:hypothetical protein